jgi:hypothetical protein
MLGTLVDFSWHTVHFESDPKPGRPACDTGRVATDRVGAWHSVQLNFPGVSWAIVGTFPTVVVWHIPQLPSERAE